jgi:hypothetical protein
VDFYPSETRDREAAKSFLKKALANPDNRPPRVFARDGLRSYSAAIRELQGEGQLLQRCRQRTKRYANNRIESDHRSIKRRMRAMQGPRTIATARTVIPGIEAHTSFARAKCWGSPGKTFTGKPGYSERYWASDSACGWGDQRQSLSSRNPCCNISVRAAATIIRHSQQAAGNLMRGSIANEARMKSEWPPIDTLLPVA